MTTTDAMIRRVQEWADSEREAGRLIFDFDKAWIIRLLQAAIGDACAKGPSP